TPRAETSGRSALRERPMSRVPRAAQNASARRPELLLFGLRPRGRDPGVSRTAESEDGRPSTLAGTRPLARRDRDGPARGISRRLARECLFLCTRYWRRRWPLTLGVLFPP